MTLSFAERLQSGNWSLTSASGSYTEPADPNNHYPGCSATLSRNASAAAVLGSFGPNVIRRRSGYWTAELFPPTYWGISGDPVNSSETTGECASSARVDYAGLSRSLAGAQCHFDPTAGNTEAIDFPVGSSSTIQDNCTGTITSNTINYSVTLQSSVTLTSPGSCPICPSCQATADPTTGTAARVTADIAGGTLPAPSGADRSMQTAHADTRSAGIPGTTDSAFGPDVGSQSAHRITVPGGVSFEAGAAAAKSLDVRGFFQEHIVRVGATRLHATAAGGCEPYKFQWKLVDRAAPKYVSVTKKSESDDSHGRSAIFVTMACKVPLKVMRANPDGWLRLCEGTIEYEVDATDKNQLRGHARVVFNWQPVCITRAHLKDLLKQHDALIKKIWNALGGEVGGKVQGIAMSRLLALLEAETVGPVLALVEGTKAEQEAARLINALLSNEQAQREPKC